jgi:hypothetical protein
MHVTVEIPDETMADLCRVLRAKDTPSAVAKAVAEFVRCEKARDFALRLRKGEFDYPATNSQIESQHG